MPSRSGCSIHIENEAAYEDAVRERRKANAVKGRRQRWLAGDPTREALTATIEGKSGGSRFMRDMADNIRKWGALLPNQEAAVRRILSDDEAAKSKRRDERRLRDAGSAFVGEVGERATFTVVLEGVYTSDTDYGVLHAHTMRDEAGNILTYRGGTRLAMPFEKGNGGFPVPVEKGARIVLKATVGKHDEYDGTRRTVLKRPTLVEAPAPRVSTLPFEWFSEQTDDRVKYPTWGWHDKASLHARRRDGRIVPWAEHREGDALLVPTAVVERMEAKAAHARGADVTAITSTGSETACSP